MLARLLKGRAICALITSATILQLSLSARGLPAWRSPFHVAFGLPDLGCGLTRAILALLRGDWRTSLTYHAFAPFFVAAIGVIALAAILPHDLREKIAAGVEKLEQHTGVTTSLLAGVVLYWLARLVLMREDFILLVN